MNNNLLKRYAVLWLDSQGQEVGAISEELGIAKSSVSRTIKLYAKTNEQDESTTTTQPVRRKTSKDFMINKTSGKGSTGVTIMTKEASEINDASKQRNSSRPDTASYIHKLDPSK
jgi:uncharacterized protein (UPF0254 family)